MFPFPVEPLELVIHPEPTTQFHNANTMVLHCVSYGFPLPSISWVQNGTTLANDSLTSINQNLVTVGGVTFVKSSLEVCSTEDSDSYYRCNIENGIDMTDFGFDLLVSSKGEYLFYILQSLLQTCTFRYLL